MEKVSPNKQKTLSKYIGIALFGSCVSIASVVSMAGTDPDLNEKIEESKANLEVARPEMVEQKQESIPLGIDENTDLSSIDLSDVSNTENVNTSDYVSNESDYVSNDSSYTTDENVIADTSYEDTSMDMGASPSSSVFESIKTNLAKNLKNLVLEQEALFNTLNSLNQEVGRTKIDLIEAKQKTKTLQVDIGRTQERLNKSFGKSETKTDELYNELKSLYYQKKQASQQVEALKNKQVTLKNEIQDRQAELATIDSRTEREILQRKSEVNNELNALFSNALPIEYAGDVKCSTNISLKSCLNSAKVKESNIRNGLAAKLAAPKFASVVSHVSLNDIAFDTTSFKYKEAYQDFSGVTNFTVLANVLVKVDGDMQNSMYDYVGIPQIGRFQITIASNVNAKFYIDGRYVGSSRVNLSVDSGTHDIKAIYNGQEKSTKESVRKNRTFVYNFNTNSKKKINVTPVSTRSKQKAPAVEQKQGTPYMLKGKAYRNESGEVHEELLTM